MLVSASLLLLVLQFSGCLAASFARMEDDLSASKMLQRRMRSYAKQEPINSYFYR